MRALVEATRQSDFPADVVAVISSRPDAEGLAWARDQGIETVALDHKRFENRAAFDAALDVELRRVRADIVALAGFMRLITADLVARWKGAMLNIHPSLLPAFKGLDTHARALQAGVKIAGCTVHFVTAEMDDGPIIAQAAVPVAPGDTAEQLADRILRAEHKLYREALKWVADGDVTYESASDSQHGTAEADAMLMVPGPA